MWDNNIKPGASFWSNFCNFNGDFGHLHEAYNASLHRHREDASKERWGVGFTTTKCIFFKFLLLPNINVSICFPLDWNLFDKMQMPRFSPRELPVCICHWICLCFQCLVSISTLGLGCCILYFLESFNHCCCCNQREHVRRKRMLKLLAFNFSNTPCKREDLLLNFWTFHYREYTGQTSHGACIIIMTLIAAPLSSLSRRGIRQGWETTLWRMQLQHHGVWNTPTKSYLLKFKKNTCSVWAHTTWPFA